MKKSFLTTCLTLILLLVLTTTVFAQAGDPVLVTGTVVEVSELDGTVTVEVDEETVVFAAPEGFDFTAIQVGDAVEVETTTDENGDTVVVSISLVEEEPQETETPTETPTEEVTETPTEEVTETPTEEVTETPTPEVTETPTPEETVAPATCPAALNQHPVGWRIANTYDLDYDEVMGWFCDGYGFGQIMLALQTSNITELPAEDLLQMKTEQGGWGRVWQGLGLIGKAKEAEAPTEEPVDAEPTDEPVDGEPTDEPVEGEPTDEPVVEEGEPTEELTVLGDQAGKDKKDKSKAKASGKAKDKDQDEFEAETLAAPEEQVQLDQKIENGNSGNNGQSDKNNNPGNSGKSDKNDKSGNGNSDKGGKPANPGNSGNSGKGKK